MTIFERVVGRLKEEEFLKDYTFRKRDSSFVKKFDGGWDRISLEHWYKWDTSYIRPCFEVRFDIVFKWFGKFSVRKAEDRRDDYLVGFSANMLGFKDSFEFENAIENIDCEYERLIECLKKGSEEVFGKYKTLQDCFSRIILPKIDGQEQFPNGGADWLFEYLTVCRIVAPERYNELKLMALKHAEWLMTRNDTPEPNMAYYYFRIDEILEFLESLDLKKMMESNGKDVIIAVK